MLVHLSIILREEIGYEIQYISYNFEKLLLGGRSAEEKPRTGNESLDVKRLHYALLDYDNE